MAAAPADRPPPGAPSVVLDTNAVLDWLVFGDARIAPLAAAVLAGRATWLASRRGREELRAVLERGQLPLAAGAESVLAQFDRHATPCADPPTATNLPRCSDPDDQVFLELAVAMRADWLITRDKALLALQARARPLGLRIATPEVWQGG